MGILNVFNLLNTRQANHIKDQLNPNSDIRREIGSVDNGKVWSGQNYGWQSEQSHKKLQEQGEFRAGHIALSRLGSDVKHVYNQAPSSVHDAVNTAVNTASDIYEGIPPIIRKPLETTLQAAGDINEAVSKTTNISPIITGEVLSAGAGSLAGKAVSIGGKAAAKYDVASRIYEAQRDVRGMGAVPLGTPGSVGAAATLPKPTNWQTRARMLYEEQKHRELADIFRRGHGGKLSKKNTFITADELALNKGGVLDQQLERADRMEGLRTKWDETGKEIKGDRQREYYDAAALNPNHKDIEMYSSDAAREYITKFTNILSKDQWHHVFGNKEAGEYILSIAHSDPLVAANLFKKMEALGLNSSGVSKNIAILKKAKHTNWHDFIKDMGFEPKSPGKPLSVKGSTAPGDFADLSQELGRAIVDGKADINDAFRLLELYADYNQWMTKQITSKKYGGKIINELPEGVGKAIQIGGYRKRPPKSNYQPLPKL